MNKRIQLQQNLDFFELSLLSKENKIEKSKYNMVDIKWNCTYMPKVM